MMTARQIMAVRRRWDDYVAEFATESGRSERRHGCVKYLEGLLREGERKSIEPLAVRAGGDGQALQRFVNQSPWDHDAVMFRPRTLMRRRAADGGVLALDDTSLPKQGRHSVGVARQYCGALGKIAHCQSIVTWQWAGPQVHWPLAARLYLLDETKPQLPAYQALVFDGGYGGILPLLAELEKRDEPYVAQVPGNIAAWPIDAVASLAQAGAGRPARHAKVHDASAHPPTMTAWRDRLLQEPSAWREVKLPRADGARACAPLRSRVRASQRAGRRRQPGATRWLLIERLGDGAFKHHFSSLPADASLEELVRLAHQRRAIEQNHQQLKEELGLDHFEGRSRRGLHHHLTPCLLAFCFLTRLRTPKKTLLAA
jgi:SRSO17 transposase